MLSDNPGVIHSNADIKKLAAQGFTLKIHLEFEVRILDTCKGGVIDKLSFTTDITGSPDKPKYSTSLKTKCPDKILDYFDDQYENYKNHIGHIK
ncbi:hypothetical protein Enr13x_49330 [Stieleria neptunia]|uniref:Uncharacterized protein n=1 Tax=Stieleria neptunia TaxID=2527979 RepID=A0A518HW31_9BACT|nr:hypothetical protein [Stieleria neptunia]QDV45060.1 hypothetical protein Enr13x_49330 [Stieleria neptunia]